MDEPSAKRGKHHEAQMIPGVDGHRIFGFPNSIITKLRYCDNFILTSTTGAIATNVFAANGIYDCDITGTGHQPMWRDNYAAIYDQYVVIGSKITVTFGSNSAFPMLCGIIGDDDSSITSNVQNAQEQNNGISTLAPALGGPCSTLTQTFEPLEQFGVAAKDDGASATAQGSNPSELWCYAIWAATPDGATTGKVTAKIEIEYTVKFTELVTAVQS